MAFATSFPNGREAAWPTTSTCRGRSTPGWSSWVTWQEQKSNRPGLTAERLSEAPPFPPTSPWLRCVDFRPCWHLHRPLARGVYQGCHFCSRRPLTAAKAARRGLHSQHLRVPRAGNEGRCIERCTMWGLPFSGYGALLERGSARIRQS